MPVCRRRRARPAPRWRAGVALPIQREAFGLVLVEAMLCGTPVAAVRLGAVPEIVEEGVTGSTANGMGDFPNAVLRSLELDRRQSDSRPKSDFRPG
jgi:glycosyltransferase involved in cell wall biosynthesis